MKTRIIVNTSWDVVEYGYARRILWSLGYAERRENDTDLYVYEKQEPEGVMYAKPENSSDKTILMVDEGWQSGTIHDPAGLSVSYAFIRMSKPWEELVDGTSLLRLICKRLIPDFSPETPNVQGRGLYKRMLRDSYVKGLTEAHENATIATGYNVELKFIDSNDKVIP